MIVYAAFKNSIDWSDGRQYLVAICDTQDRALESFELKDEDVQKWKEGNGELRGYYSVVPYDTTTGKRLSKEPLSRSM